MSRANKFVRGVISGYASIAVNVLFTMGAIPVALHYLGKEEFGLWSLVVQLTGYLSLLDLGMGVATSRFLADYKDDVNGGGYGSVLRTGQAVFLIQAVLVTSIGTCLIIFSSEFLNIPERLQHIFTVLMSVQCAVAGLSFATKMAGAPLWCHQRYDIANLSGSVSLILNFGVMWAGFNQGLGLYSMIFASVSGFIISLIITWQACLRLGFYPAKGCWGNFDIKLFREMFMFGKDIFLMSLGGQLASASQVIVISRLMGLEAVSVWAVATKVFTFALQFVMRIYDSSAGALTEMFVRSERERLKIRFDNLLVVTGSVAVFVAAGIAVLNADLIEIWTSGKIHWSSWNDVLLGILLCSNVLTRCHSGLMGVVKDIRGLKYAFLIEGIFVLGLSFILVPYYGFPGLLFASILSNMSVTGFYSVRRNASFFGEKFSQLIRWSSPSMTLALVLVPISVLVSMEMSKKASWFTFLMWVCAYCLISLPVIFYAGLNKNLRAEIWSRVRIKFG